MLLPENLCLAVNTPDPKLKIAVADILAGKTTSLVDTLSTLGRAAKIKVWFSRPVTVYIHAMWRVTSIDTNGSKSLTKRHKKETSCHVFSKLIKMDTNLYYALERHSHKGYPFDWLDLITKYEIVSPKSNEFQSYEEFKRKFDPLFITEDEIKKLWNGHSSQHGGKYTRQDFHKIGPRGREVLKRFLRGFQGVSNAPTAAYGNSYLDDADYKVLREYYKSYRHTGRDINISHQTNCNNVFYSSEFHCCGNGRYGIMANKNEFLHIEDD